MVVLSVGRKELLMMVREISQVIFLDGEMSDKEKVLRVRQIIIDGFTESEQDTPPKFGGGE